MEKRLWFSVFLLARHMAEALIRKTSNKAESHSSGENIQTSFLFMEELILRHASFVTAT